MLSMGLGPQRRLWIWAQVAALVFAAASPTTAEVRPGAAKPSSEEPVLVAAATKSKSRPKTSAKKTSSKPSTSKSESASSKKATPSDEGEKEDAAADGTKEPKQARKSEPAVPLTTETLPQRLEQIIRSAGSRSAWGVKIIQAETGQQIFGHSDGEHFIPASNRKVFTGALALDQLGPDYRFRTYLYRTGNVDSSGTLQGNLVILPQGDPTFSNRINGKVDGRNPTDWVYRKWVDQVKAAGITHVAGDILIDASDWVWNDLQPTGWPNRILQDNYAVIPAPLTINENIMGIKVRPGTGGGPPAISFYPAADGYPVNCTAVSGGNGTAKIVRPPVGPIQITGSVNRVVEDAKPCDNPTLFAAAVFRHRLREGGINLSGTARIITRRGVVPAPTSESVIAMYESPRMADMVKTMMKQSNNHFAEQLFVAVSAAKTGKGGYTESRRLENELLKKAGVDVSNLRFGDGSGLSEANQVTPEQMTKLLAYMLHHPHGQAYVDAMAVGGVDGTLRGRMQTEALRGKIYAKTGFINGVSCLSGYYFREPGRTYIFSFLVNRIPGGPGGAKSAQEQLLQTLSRL